MKPQSHREFRESVCLGCLPGTRRKVTPKLEKKVREKIFAGSSTADTGLPVGLCGGCERALYKDKPFPSLGVNYDKLKVSRQDVQVLHLHCWKAKVSTEKKTWAPKQASGYSRKSFQAKGHQSLSCL